MPMTIAPMAPHHAAGRHACLDVVGCAAALPEWRSAPGPCGSVGLGLLRQAS